MPMWKWFASSPASNGSADPAINWQEGQAPSTVNDSARALMSVIKQHDVDISGAIVTSGTSTAYTVSSFSGFTALTDLSGQPVAFTPHATNGGTVTLNVDSISARPLRSSPGVELQAGVLIQGTPYVAVYNSTDGAFYLRNFYGSPYNIPLGASIDYWGFTAPNSTFAIVNGQALSRTTYATLFSLIGSTYGAGDGSTTFNIPDRTGRASVMKEASASRLTFAVSGVNSTLQGSAGGSQGGLLAANQIPSLTASGSNSITVNPGGSAGNFVPFNTTGWTQQTTQSAGTQAGPISNSIAPISTTSSFSGSNSISVAYTNGSPVAVPTVLPVIVCNHIMRVL